MTVDGYVIYKLSGETRVEFSYIGGARAINPFGSVSAALDNLLPTKNEQLTVQGRLRTLLILNADIFGQEYDTRRYFSTKDPERFPNLDRVFFEIAPGNVSLIFDRRVFDRYREGSCPTMRNWPVSYSHSWSASAFVGSQKGVRHRQDDR